MHKDIRQLYDLAYSGDSWGSCMDHWFTCAGTLYRHGGEIPHEWRYRPGLYEDELDEEDWTAGEYEEMLADGDIGLDDILEAGRVFDRYARALRHAGQDY